MRTKSQFNVSLGQNSEVKESLTFGWLVGGFFIISLFALMVVVYSVEILDYINPD